MSTTTDSNKNILENLEVHQPYIIEKQYLSKKKNKQYNLLDNKEDGSQYFLRNKWYLFILEEPLYCQEIIYKSDSKCLDGLTTVVIDGFGNEAGVKIRRKASDHIALAVGQIITAFKVHAPDGKLDKVSLNTINVKGYLQSDFHDIEDKVAEYQHIRSNITNELEHLSHTKATSRTLLDKNEKNISRTRSQLNKLQTESDVLTNKIVKNKITLGTLSENIISSDSRLNSTNKSITSARNNLDNLRNLSKHLDDEIKNSEEELSRLANNKNLFAYEIEDYMRQGRKDISLYTILSFLPWVLITYITWLLFNGAVDLSLIDYNADNVNLVDVLLSRLPFVIVTSAIIVASYLISRMFAVKIFEINSQRLRFSEIGIIAKDISHASTDHLNLKDQDKYELRTKLKMDLLRHHMKKLGPEMFEYKIYPFVWDKYLKFFSDSTKDSLVTQDRAPSVSKLNPGRKIDTHH